MSPKAAEVDCIPQKEMKISVNETYQFVYKELMISLLTVNLEIDFAWLNCAANSITAVIRKERKKFKRRIMKEIEG